MSLRRKLFLIIFCISLVVFLVSVTMMYIHQHQQITGLSIEKMEAILINKKHALQEQASHLRYGTALLASRTHLKQTLKDYNSTQNEKLLSIMNENLNEVLQAVDGIDQLGILNLEGEIIESTSRSLIGTDCDSSTSLPVAGSSDLDRFQFKMGNDSSVHIIIIEPLMLSQEHIGYLTVCHNTENIRKIVFDYTGLGQTGYTLLSKHLSNDAILLSGRRVDGNISPWQIVKNNDLGQISNQALSGRRDIFADILDWEQEHYLAVTDYCESFDMGISVRVAESETFQSLRRLRNILVTALIVASIIISWISSLVAKAFTKPIKALTLATEKISTGDYSQRVVAKSQNEIGRLAQSFNTMIESIRTAQEETLAEEQKALDYLNVALTAIIALDNSGTIILANPYSEKVLGYQTGELLGKEWFDTCIPKSARKEIKSVFEKLMNGDLKPVEYHQNLVLTKAGEERIFVFHDAVLTNDVGEIVGILSSSEDITQRKEIERQVYQVEKLASMGQLVSDLAHKLRNPLAIISSTAQNYKDDTKVSAAYYKAFEVIKRNADSAGQMIYELLHFAGSKQLKIKSNSLFKTLEKVHDMIEPDIHQQGIRFMKENIDSRIVALYDEESIMEVLMNIYFNALQAIKESGFIRTSLSSSDGYALVKIEDNGCGIPEENLFIIFDPFFSTKDSGTGLGLSSARRILERHQGSITVESTINKGTIVTINLPKE